MVFITSITGNRNAEDIGLKAKYISLISNTDIIDKETRIADGFIIMQQAFESFLDAKMRLKIKNLLSLVNIENKAKTQAIANNIQKIIISKKMPYEIKTEIIDSYHQLKLNSDESLADAVKNKELAVVAMASPVMDEKAYFPEHYINFLSISDDDDLIKKVKLCWASLYTAKAIEDRERKNITDYSMAVVVQKAINFDSSARANANEKTIGISAVTGNLKAMEETDYDRYAVDAETKEIKEIKIGKQEFKIVFDSANAIRKFRLESDEQKISSEKIIEISEIAKKIRKKINENCVISVGIKDDIVYVLSIYKIDSEKEKEWDKEKIIEKIIQDSPKEDERQEISIVGKSETEKKEKQIGITEIKHDEKKSIFSDLTDPLLSIFKRKKDEYGEEQNIDDSSDDSQKEKTMQTVLVDNNSINMLYHDLSNIAVVCDMAISEKLRQKYLELVGDQLPFFDDIITELKAKTDVPLEEDIKKTRALRNKFLEKGKALTKDEIMFCISTAERFLKLF